PPVKRLQQPVQVRARPPPRGALIRPCSVVLQHPQEKRAATLELAQHVPAQPRLLLQELPRPALPLVPTPGLAHTGADQRQGLDRVDERVPFEELLLLPEQPVERGTLVRAEAAPQDEILRRGDRRDRGDLDRAEAPPDVEDAPRRAVEQRRPDRDAARLCDFNLPAHG